MDYLFEDWQKVLANFQSSVEKDLEEMRKCKNEVLQMRAGIHNDRNTGLYLRDDFKVVISAPEIIIGNVDKSGGLRPGEVSRVVLRGGTVNLDGVGEAGQVQTRAASIRQIAVDPGVDGQEAVVGALSEVVSQARSIVVEADKAAGAFSRTPSGAGDGGVRIHADGGLVLDASVSAEVRKSSIEKSISGLEELKNDQKKEADDCKKAFDEIVKKLQKLIDHSDSLMEEDEGVRTNVYELDDMEMQLGSYAPALYQAFENCSNALSALAETNRQLKCLKEEKGKIKTGDAFKKSTTGAFVAVKGEMIALTSEDGDGNLRDNDGSGVRVIANEVAVESREWDRKLKEKGSISLQAKTINVSTANPADLKYDDKGKLTTGKFPVEGDVFIKSKNISLEAVDNELADSKDKETALTKEGSIKMRAEKMDLSATDTEGKATGSLTMNAKAVSLRSMDVEKEKRTDDKLAAGSTMVLVSEKMYLGAKSKDVKSKKVQAVSEEVGLFADKTLETQQGDGKATLQLADGKAALGGSETQVYGKTTINAATEVKAELKAPKATIDNVEAKSSFKSPNISDGIAVPGAPSSAKLSAKLKTEDAPKE